MWKIIIIIALILLIWWWAYRSYELANNKKTITTTIDTQSKIDNPNKPADIVSDKKNNTDTNEPTDYSYKEHWLNLPSSEDKKVDVFYLYPTSWQKIKPTEPNICDIDNPVMLKGAPLAFARQATAFESVANIYAPYYRQVDAAYSLKLPLEEQEKITGGIPKSDIFAAFDYYIKNYNKDRPFILAGHSQGSNLLIYLLSDYMKENPEVYKRMVVAYVIGYSVTEEYLAKNPHLKFAKGPNDTWVIVSYNTEAPTIPWKNPVVLSWAISINPITWTREETLATTEENLGSIQLNSNGTVLLDDKWEILPIKNYADARVDKAKWVLICSTLDQTKLQLGFGPGIFHSYDYPLYFFNIRENALNRVKAYLWEK